MNFSLYIAKRYLFSKSKNNAINIITGIASIGIIVGTLALLVVLSVFSGLRDFSLSFSNKIDPDLKVNPLQGKTFFITSKQVTQSELFIGTTGIGALLTITSPQYDKLLKTIVNQRTVREAFYFKSAQVQWLDKTQSLR